MRVSDLVDQLLNCNQNLPVLLRVQNEDGDQQLMADDLSISVSAGCGEVEYCIIDGIEPEPSYPETHNTPGSNAGEGLSK